MVIFVKKYFPFAASLAFQMVGFHKELWLSGAVTPARRSDDPRPRLRMTTLFSLGHFCKKYPFTAFLGLLMLGLYKELWLSGDVTPARGSEESGKM